MRKISIHEAKTHLSRLIEEVASGDCIFISKAGKPVARLVGIEPHRAQRTFGLLKGKIQIADDFDAPLSAEVVEVFERQS
jgi:prevent-host-death family protein